MKHYKRVVASAVSVALIALATTTTELALAAPGDITTVAGIADTTGYTDYYYTEHVTLDAAGNLYYSSGDQIIKRDTSGLIAVVAGTNSGYSGDGGLATSAQLSRPKAVALDTAGNLYIADSSNNRIRMVDIFGSITTVAGNGVQGSAGDDGLATAAQLSNPRGVAVDAAGNLYIADTYNNRIRRVDGITGIITTLVGTGVAGYSGDGGPASAAQIYFPVGLTVDGVGNLYIADQNYAIRKVDISGIITTLAGDGSWGYSGDGGPASAAQMAEPRQMSVDSAGNLYFADSFNNRIRRVDGNSGVITTVAGDGTPGYSGSGDGGQATAAQLNTPMSVAVAVDGSGRMIIADSRNLRIREVDATGVITSIAKGIVGYSGDNVAANTATLNGPSSVAADSVGNIYIADYYNFRARKVDTVGTITTVAGDGSQGNALSQLGYANGVAADSLGNRYIADTGSHRILRVDSVGIVTKVAGTGYSGFSGDNGLATVAQLNNPTAVAVDAQGNLFIADQKNFRIRRVDSSGIITTVAGVGTTGFSGDGGDATVAQLGYVDGIAVDSTGNLVIADSTNNRIRRVDGESIITTVVGTGVAGFSGDGGAASAAELKGPRGVAVDDIGNLYIADSGNQRVRMVNTSGNILTLAGDGSPGFSGDNGPATSAQLQFPQAVSADNLGNLYIADTSNHRIRKLELHDVNPPVISLLGDSTMSVVLGDNFIDPGSSVTDNYDTGLTANVSGSVDTSVLGDYILTYTVSDAEGNAATPVTRTVSVVAQSGGSGASSGGGGAFGWFSLLLAGLGLLWRRGFVMD
jgi:sugar lactone lactonase YvrE